MAPRIKVAIVSRYCLKEQQALAAEFGPMLEVLAQENDVLHLSLSGRREGVLSVPDKVIIKELALSIDRKRPSDIAIKSLLMYFWLPRIACVLNQFKPDVIFLSEILPLMGILLKWLTRARVATAYGDWHLHNIFGRRKGSKAFLRMMESADRFEVRRLDGFFCRAEAAGSRVQSWGAPPAAVRVVRDAPDPQSFFPRDETSLRAQCGFTPDDIILVYHGVMHPGKGIDLLIRWTSELYEEDPRYGLVLVGGGPAQSTLRALASSLPIGPRTVFPGWLPTVREVGAYCCAGDINVAMRTAAEANDRVVPGALLHSMACRKVTIAPRLSGTSEIIRHGENGFLFTADSGDDFKTLVKWLANNRPRWDAVADNAYSDIETNFSVRAAAHSYADALTHFATYPAARK